MRQLFSLSKTSLFSSFIYAPKIIMRISRPSKRNKIELLVEGVVDSLSHNLLRGLLPVSANNATFPASGSIPFEFAHSLLWAVE